METQSLNDKLRAINAELRRQREAQETILSAVGGLGSSPGATAGAASDAEDAAAALEALRRQEVRRWAGALPARAAGRPASCKRTQAPPARRPASPAPTRAAAAAAAAAAAQELLQQERSLLEAALSSPSAAHPTEGFGAEGLSIAGARRAMHQAIR